MPSILAINGSYRTGGITDQAIAAARDVLESSGAAVEVVALRDYPIEFCLNCRECMQQAGTEPGHCVHDDAMRALVEKIETADGYILASPTNFGSATAVYKRFMERLAVYGHWPWGDMAPRKRKARRPRKKAMLISTSAAPGWMGRWLYHTRGQLKLTAKTIGARPVAVWFGGPLGSKPAALLPEKLQARIRNLARKLL